MSFTNTPLGQQRRLGRDAFLNGTKKQQLKPSKLSADNDQAESQQTSPPRRSASTHTIPVSYSYGAPELARSGSGSPPKAASIASNRPSSPSRSVTTSHNEPSEEPNTSSEPADVRYARLKQRNQALGPTASSSSLLRDTSVNVANAFTQAAFSKLGGSGTMPKPKTSASWSSGNRLVPPPASSAYTRSSSALREEDESNFAGNDTSEVDINGDPISRGDRAKTPLYDALGAAGTFLLNQAKRATSRQPEDSASTTNIQQSLSSVDRTSDYEDAEALYQRAKSGLVAPSSDAGKSASNPSKKKPRKSRDNALYKPTESESEESDGVDSDEGKRKKKAKLVKGMSLPIIGPSKTIRSKKPRGRSSRPNVSVLGGEDLRSVSNLVQVDEEPSILPPSRGRTRSRSRSHTPRAQSVGGQTTDSYAEEQELDEALLDDDSNAYTDPELREQSREIAAAQQAARTHTQPPHSYPPQRANKGLGVGAALGTFVRSVVRASIMLNKKMKYDAKVLVTILVLISALWAGVFRSSSSTPTPRPVPQPAKPSRGFWGSIIPGWSSSPPTGYEHVPMPAFDLPPGSLEELIQRLTILERAQRSTDTVIGDVTLRVGNVEGYVGNVDQRIGQVDTRMGQVEGRVGSVEGRVGRVDERVAKVDDRIEQFDARVDQVDSRVEQFGTRIGKVDGLVGQMDARVSQVDSRIGQVDSKVGRMDSWVGQVDARMDQLGARVGNVEQAGPKPGKADGKAGAVDGRVAKEFEARAREIEVKAKEIEGQAKRFEGRAKEIDAKANEIDAKTKEIDSKTKEIDSKTKELDSKAKELDAKSREHDAKSRDFESKLREIEARFKDAGGSWWTRTRTGGGQQQEPLAIGSEAMDQIVQRAVLATTKDTVARADFALYTGGGRVIPEYTSPTFSVSPTSGWRRMLGIGTVHGRSPAVALVPDINVGNCWPFAGSQGQIAVLLSRSVRVDAVTIDHASKDVAYDLRAAPRKFSVWGLVEGADNLEKLAKYQDDLKAQTIGTGSEGQVEDVDGPGFGPARILLAEFEYDINAGSHIQTFDVSERVRQAQIDVGVVVFQIRSSWGDPNFTCLYRVRVHGEAVGPNVSGA